MTRITATALLCLLGAAPAAFAAESARSPYAGEQYREIKALSGKEVQDLLAGRGMGLAKSAELNRYPGPAHVLELSDRLGLSMEQKARSQSVFDAMEARSRELGKALVEREAELDRLFATREVTRATLESSLAEIAKLQGELRGVHLEAHLAQTDILTAEQVASYAELRGYGGMDHSGHGGGNRH